MNTTKTLEEIKTGIVNWYGEKFLDYHQAKAITEKVWNAALDACRDNVKDMSIVNLTFVGTEAINGYVNKEGVLAAIDSLRTGRGKETPMQHQVVKVRNGLWRVVWENGSHSEHSSREGAEKMAFQIESRWEREDSLKDPQG